eukprot:TRINITY_DN20907_c0_g1_i3.p1 TRINITY_DN20907_c0_g1~~TRINITY_DN20907_c0_g1_i3.p1  ORF type:complete len:303 (-),score=99.13 TRINITY_DN20907_c0_g1_i3:144-1052(-)
MLSLFSKLYDYFCIFFFFFKQKTAYEMLRSLVGSEMCIRDRYNKSMNIDVYTEAEYNEHMVSPEWTKDQTDELLDLAKRFDTRFILVSDRFSGDKSLEELKARYYFVAQKMLEIRSEYTDEELHKMPLARFKYDKKYEEDRKTQLKAILSRTVREMAEEHMLLQELQAIDSTMKKDQKFRARARKAAEALGAEDGRGTGTRAASKQAKKMRIGGGNKTLIVKVKGVGVSGGSGERKSTQRKSQMGTNPETSHEAKVLQRMQNMGVPAWPLPMANVCAAHAELVKDVGRLMLLEQKAAKKRKI